MDDTSYKGASLSAKELLSWRPIKGVNKWQKIPARTSFGRKLILHIHHPEHIGQNRGKPLFTSINLASKSVNPAVFIGAPKFHSGGLVGDEVPIIAKRGETIFTKGQMQALGGELNRKTPVTEYMKDKLMEWLEFLQMVCVPAFVWLVYKVGELRKELNDFKVQVAREYATQVHINRLETKIDDLRQLIWEIHNEGTVIKRNKK